VQVLKRSGSGLGIEKYFYSNLVYGGNSSFGVGIGVDKWV
jgi:hypothetical protein